MLNNEFIHQIVNKGFIKNHADYNQEVVQCMLDIFHHRLKGNIHALDMIRFLKKIIRDINFNLPPDDIKQVEEISNKFKGFDIDFHDALLEEKIEQYREKMLDYMITVYELL